MRGLTKMLSRYVGAAIGVGLFLLLLNFSLFIAFGVLCQKSAPETKDRVTLIANGVSRQADGSVAVSDEARRALDERYVWAMQLDEQGNVIWGDRLPEDLPRHYSASDIASFARWYLEDYPVYVWSDGDGLLVLASARGSEWKYAVTTSSFLIRQGIRWVPGVLLLNLLTALLLALLLGWRMYRAAAPLAGGIEQLAEEQPVELPVRGVLGDLSADLNRASQKLRTQRDLLDKRDRTRTEWIAGVSHDIRTPLALVQGSAAQLEEDARLPADARQKAALIRQNSQRMGRLVSDLNLASKLEYEMQPLQKILLRPAALLRTVAAEALNSLPEDAAAQIEVRIPPELGELSIYGDEKLLIRAVENLLRNSLAHNGNTVSIRLSLRRTANACHILVTDNGAGLPADVLARLRTPHQDTLPAHGLGLILVRQIAQAHGGAVLFENLLHGLCVTISLPM
ncbi:HAMP domain-containing sensor histidine kinase [Agathobaculum sp. NTUH-O15-33]|uniref:sensor histidine kinase n=1 Tax=Agathobaculum sp. NTUH-O15-33 TaxID=3079302 RepID=UPI002958D34E|nr:HAMP domain-containing sensor histidine kinase [Agathobaculum sp. NTUH-O15-33]WNX82993.1 HAMP domain-containing sensor histidine kinase [Agathobaculum sp. NTUH-O15-33]